MPPYTERDLLSGMRDQAASHSAAELLVRNGDVNWDGSVSLDQHLSMMEASSGHPPPRPARLQRSAAASLLLQVAAMLQRQTAADLRGAAGWWRRTGAPRLLVAAAARWRREEVLQRRLLVATWLLWPGVEKNWRLRGEAAWLRWEEAQRWCRAPPQEPAGPQASVSLTCSGTAPRAPLHETPQVTLATLRLHLAVEPV